MAPTLINFTLRDNQFATASDSDDGGSDADVVSLIGPVKFIPQINRPALGTTLSPQAMLSLRTIDGYYDTDGQLKNKRGGAVGVRIPANDPVLGLSRLPYKAVFGPMTTPRGDVVPLPDVTFDAPATDTTIWLPSVAPLPGATALGITKGDPGDPVDDVQLVGDEVQFYVQGQPVGDPLALLIMSGILVPTAIKTAGSTLVAGDMGLGNTTGGGFTFLLPNAPPNNTIVGATNWVATPGTQNTLIVQRQGSDTIGPGDASTFQMPEAGQSTWFLYKSSTTRWHVMNHGTPLTSLDARYVHAADGTEVVLQSDTGNQLQITNGSGYLVLEPIGSDTTIDTYLYAKGPSGDIWFWNTTATDSAKVALTLTSAGSRGTARFRGVSNLTHFDFSLEVQGDGIVYLYNTTASKPAILRANNSNNTADMLLVADPGRQILVADNQFAITGSSDATKKALFEVDGLTTATTRTVTVPDASGTMLMTGAVNTIRDDRFILVDDADATKRLMRDLANIPTGVTRKMVMPVSNTAQASVTNTTTETALISMTLPTGVLVAGSTFRIRIAGSVQVQATSGTLALTPYLGTNYAQQYFSMPSQGSAVGASKFWCEYDIVVRTTGVSGTFVAGGSGLLPIGPWYPIGSASAGTSVIDTTGTPVVKLTAQWQTASATNALLVETATIEQIV